MTAQGQIVPSSPAIAQAIRTDTEYVVLSKDDSGLWNEEARMQAKSPDAAIIAVIGDGDPGKKQWNAVAIRYWSPVWFDVKVERSLIPKAAKP